MVTDKRAIPREVVNDPVETETILTTEIMAGKAKTTWFGGVKPIGRPLEKWELVHHLNGMRDDNRIENLELLKHNKEHLPSMNVQRIVSELQARVAILEAEVVRLESLLNVSRDSVPDNDLRLRHYDTPGTVRSEGIVQAPSNRWRNG